MADPVPTTVIPWYQSRVLQGIVVTAVSQLISQTKFASLFTSDNVTTIIGYVFDGISALSLWYAAHARATKASPPLVSSQAKADAINTASAKLGGK